jgi:uncharacterized protein (UPF0147 family)
MAKNARRAAEEELPKLNAKQRSRLEKIYAQLRNMQGAHSDSVAGMRQKHFQMEQQIAEYKKEMTRTASSMLESVGLDPNDPAIMYSVDPTTGIISQTERPQQLAPAAPKNGATDPEPSEPPPAN